MKKWYSTRINKFDLNGIKLDLKEGFITLDDSNGFEKVNDITLFISRVDKILKDIKGLNRCGFLVKPVNIPLIIDFIIHFKLSKSIEEVCKSKCENKSDLPYASLELNKWCYNLIILILYLESLKIIISITKENTEDSDVITDLKQLLNNLESKLDPTITRRLKKTGISITQNVYLGFDTEYELQDSKKNLNELLSIQLAANTKVLVKIPVENEFTLEYLHPLTSEAKDKMKKYSQGLEMVVTSINYNIQKCISLKYPGYKGLMCKITKGFEEIPNVKSFEKLDKKIFIFPYSEVRELFKFLNEYSLTNLIQDTNSMIDGNIKENALALASVLNIVLGEKVCDEEKMVKAFNKRSSRLSIFYKSERIYLTTRLNLILCSHLTNADLSILKDFKDFKEDLTIVNKYFVTAGKGLKRDDWRFIIHIRDTMLLAPGNSKRLAEIGKIYGEDFRKIDIKKYRGNMKLLAVEDKALFKEYAMRDALIVLKHVNMMEEFNESLKRTGVPLTLTSISKAYVMNEWDELGYSGYQMRNGYSFGSLRDLLTPKGINASGSTGLALNHYISSYRGGRNESFMFGVDKWFLEKDRKEKGKMWVDYDLSGAYPTVMVFLGDPDYSSARLIDKIWLDSVKASVILNSYTVLNVSFEYLTDVKYPCIPCQVDEDITVYPLKGVSTITGLEYLLAIRQGCKINLESGYYIPFKMDKKLDGKELEKRLVTFESLRNFEAGFKNLVEKPGVVKPFDNVVKKLIIQRKEHPKGSFKNLMYKTIANSIYGLTAQGIGAKKKFDVQTGGSKILGGGDLSNPLIAGYITSFVRTVISECLHNINVSGGRVVSVTTDGFITDIDNLEDLLLSKEFKDTLFLRMFSALRRFVTDNPNEFSLEVKNVEGESDTNSGKEDLVVEKGLISWTTRGQLGFTSGIKACTGFQSNGLNKESLKEVLMGVLDSGDLTSYEYIQDSLRSAKDIILKGGQVTKILKDQSFKMVFDNKRKIIKPEKPFDITEGLLDSKPWINIKDCEEVRSLIKIVYNTDYNCILTRPGNKKYKTDLETAVRTFVKGLFIEDGLFGVTITEIGSYNALIQLIKGFKHASELTISKDSISKLKNRRVVWRTVPKNVVCEEFVDYIRSKYPNFKSDKFFKVNKVVD